MDNEQKLKSFDKVQKILWNLVVEGNPLISALVASIIRECGIYSPENNSPEEA